MQNWKLCTFMKTFYHYFKCAAEFGVYSCLYAIGLTFLVDAQGNLCSDREQISVSYVNSMPLKKVLGIRNPSNKYW